MQAIKASVAFHSSSSNNGSIPGFAEAQDKRKSRTIPICFVLDTLHGPDHFPRNCPRLLVRFREFSNLVSSCSPCIPLHSSDLVLRWGLLSFPVPTYLNLSYVRMNLFKDPFPSKENPLRRMGNLRLQVMQRLLISMCNFF